MLLPDRQVSQVSPAGEVSQLVDEPRLVAPLAALDDLREPDADAAYDDIAALAAQICDVPVALVSFPGRQRHWHAAARGLTISDTAQAHSFCAHAIEVSNALLVIEDATRDARFAANPLVTGDLHLRFYVGAPIVTAAGAVVGTVCVIDTRPRQLDEAQRDALIRLARQAASLLALRARAQQAESRALERDRLAAEADRHQKQSDQLLDLVLRGGDLGLWDLDVASGQWTINARERAMLGYSALEAQPGKLDWKALVHPEDWRAFAADFGRHLLGITPFCEFVHRMRHRDGQWVWVMSRCVAVERGDDGSPLRVVGTHMDVTAQKRAEEERRKNGERLELALSGGDIGLWDLDLRSGRATYNAQWWAMFGYAVGEIEAVDGLWQSMVHPADYEGARAGLARHVNGQTPMYEGEVRVRHKDGHWLWIQNRAKVVERGLDGTALRIVGVNLNITGSKQNVLALEVEQRRLRLITDNIPALITELDLDERVIFCNGRYQSWLGMAPESMLDRPIREALGEALYELRKPELARAFAGETVSFEETAQLLVGPRTLQTTYLPHKNEEGAVVGLYCLANDISELKHKQLLLDALAREDALTGLPNRRSFEERVCDAMARSRRSRSLLCLMYLDVDNFKHINDSHGHAGGDAVLKEFARRIKRGVRTTDMAARYAGDEFVVLLEGV
ncbi:MAG: hypothetical protein JWQ73_154, partial [Variovorax sp.]|nr:hypothetical protein [Variovorax sp.]